ncbi:MAG: hypothetical protein [Caudoviricetes sp.]|nr:MAG: hypothetical protein [Caudoviricetes sp.]
MTKKTIIFDTDDESKGHYPSDETYAPLEVGKVYNVTEDTIGKHIILSPVDANSSLPTMKFGQLALEIDTKDTSVGAPLLTGTTIVDASNPSNPTTSLVALMTDGDIWGPKWGGSLTQPMTLSSFIKSSIEHSVEGSLSSGWTRLQNGLLLQWGTVSGTVNAYQQITFPTAFTTIKTVIPAAIDTWNNDSYTITIYLAKEDIASLTKQGFYCHPINGSAGPIGSKNWTANWIAIGY